MAKTEAKSPTDGEDQDQSLTNVFKVYFLTTTIRGIGRAYSSKYAFLKVLWSLATLCGAGVALFSIIDTALEYHSHAVFASFTETTNRIHFPDITLCKTTGISDLETVSSGMRISEYFATLQKHRNLFSLSSISSILATTNYTNTVSNQGTAETLWNSVASITGYLENIDPIMDQEISNRSMFIQTPRAVDWDWSDVEVPWEDAITFIPTVTHAVCATVSLPRTLASRTRGISIMLYMGETGHEPAIPSALLHPLHSRSSGATCMIHKRKSMPNMHDAHFLSAGTENTVNLYPRAYTRLRTSDETCLDDASERGKFYFPGPSNYTYSVGACQLHCRARRVYDGCGCYDASVLANRWSNKNTCGSVRDFKNITRDDLIDLIKTQLCVLESHTKSSDKCLCPLTCKDFEYDADLSNARWPHPSVLRSVLKSSFNIPPSHTKYFSHYYDILADEEAGLLTQDEASLLLQRVGVIEKNFLQLDIKFPVETVMLANSHYTITFSSLVALVGGNLNLWIGVSFITLVELMELIYISILRLTKLKRSQGKVAKRKRQETSF